MISKATPTPPPASLHQRILADLQGKILSGEWLPGARIATEHELAARYDCSRMTVSSVLGKLVRAGLVERRRKAGTFVKRPHSQAAVLEIHDIKTEVLALGLPYRFALSGREARRSTHADRACLGVGASGRILALVGRHFAGAKVFCLEERLINLTAVPPAAQEDFSKLAPGGWLLESVPWTAAEHKIRAVAAGASTAAALAARPGATCLVVERRTWRAEIPVTHVRLTYPGNAHELIARFTPSQT
jgi:GntR family histidine utilization transcriptional repressor